METEAKTQRPTPSDPPRFLIRRLEEAGKSQMASTPEGDTGPLATKTSTEANGPKCRHGEGGGFGAGIGKG